jgi:hypothetical protein
LYVTHGLVNVGDAGLFRNDYCHTDTLALLTLVALDFVCLYFCALVKHVAPFSALPLKSFAVLNLP